MFPFLSNREYPKARGTPEALVIMDMQYGFLPEAPMICSSEYAMARSNLISKVKERIAYHMEKSNDIVLVSYSKSGDIVSEIEEQLRYYVPLRLKKNRDSLFHSLQNNRSEALYGLYPLKESKIELVGVNASVCVVKTGASLYDHKFDTRIRVDCVLNSLKKEAFDNDAFLKYNKLSYLQKSYREFFGIFLDDDYFPERRDLTHLLDMGIDQVEERFIWDL